MAVTLSATPFSTTLPPSRNTNCGLKPVLPNLNLRSSGQILTAAAKPRRRQCLAPPAGLKIIELYMEGYRQDWKLSFEQDTVARGGWQKGEIIVVGHGKTNILYIHKDKEAGDDPDIKDILKACCGDVNSV